MEALGPTIGLLALCGSESPPERSWESLKDEQHHCETGMFPPWPQPSCDAEIEMLDSLRNRMFEALPDHATVKVLIEGEADWLTLNVVSADVVGVAFESEGAAISCYPWRSIRALALDHLSANSRPPSAA